MENGALFHVAYEGRVVNKAAKSSWINGTADLMPHARRMMHVGVTKEAEMNVSPYFCHVPNANLADDPSRGLLMLAND